MILYSRKKRRLNTVDTRTHTLTLEHIYVHVQRPISLYNNAYGLSIVLVAIGDCTAATIYIRECYILLLLYICAVDTIIHIHIYIYIYISVLAYLRTNNP